MANATRQSKPITWIVPLATRELVAKHCGSQSYAEKLILEWVADVVDPVRWKYAGVRPPDHPLDRFWQRLETFNWLDGTATALMVLPIEVGVERVTLYPLK
jgi:hypothetical protein